MKRRRVYIVAPDAAALRVGRSLAADALVVVHEPAELAGRPPGLLLLPRATLAEGGRLLAVLDRIAAGPADDPWLPVLVEDGPDGPLLRPLSLGWATPLGVVSRWVAGDPGAEVLELRHALEGLARARHDLNNPLTSAMAETQLALMDAPADLREGLETVQEQLRRIRDRVAALRTFRPPA